MDVETIEAVTADSIKRIIDMWFEGAARNGYLAREYVLRRVRLDARDCGGAYRLGKLFSRIQQYFCQGYSIGDVSIRHVRSFRIPQ
jgi:hypothetical protein